MMYTKECPVCYSIFETDVHNKLYCSNKCSRTKWAEIRKSGIKKTYPNTYFNSKHCRWCGEKFTPTGPSSHFCSDKCSTKGQRDAYYKRNYGVGYREYLIMHDNNNGKCWICDKSSEDNGIRLALDHDHITGEVRGLLCTDCNIGLGKLGDCIEGVEKALKYLKGEL